MAIGFRDADFGLLQSGTNSGECDAWVRPLVFRSAEFADAFDISGIKLGFRSTGI